MVYNVPSRTGFRILPETYVELAKISNIKAIKEACGDLAAIKKTAELTAGKLDLYSGDDEVIREVYSFGGIGVVSVAGNIIPDKISELCALAASGKADEAKAMQDGLMPFIKALFCEVNPIPVKTAAKILGFGTGILRLPLTDMEPQNLEFLTNEMKKIGLI